MIRNYLKVALRNLVKQRIYTAINIVGLSVGIGSCLLICLFVVDEFSYDKFHTNSDRLYKIVLERKYPNHITNYAIIPHSYAEVINRDFPEVETSVRLSGLTGSIVTYKNERNEVKRFEEQFFVATDSNFFEVFSIPLPQGDPKKVLRNPEDVVLTKSTAHRYFGNDNPVGKTLRIFDQDFDVTGVCEDVPENSHMKFDFLGKWSDRLFGGGIQSNFITFSANTYLLLKPGADAKALESKFPRMVDTYASAQIEQDLGKSWEEYKREGNGYRYSLQPLTSIHLDPSNIEAKFRAGGNLNYVYFLMSIAALILVIACINFMNLATARSAERAREVGVRKTMGSMKSQLVYQFLIESILLSLLATFIALILAQVSLSAFNELAGKSLSIGYSPMLVGGLVFVALFVGFMAGSYPAFALSAIQPLLVMKGRFTSSAKGSWLRNGLVVFQFTISIILIVGTLVVIDQMNFMQNKSLGYNKDHLIVVERAFLLREKLEPFKEELKALPQVIDAGISGSLLGRSDEFFGEQFKSEGSSEILTTKSMAVNDDFTAALGFEFLDGHGFSKETNDSLSILLNETAVKTLDIKNPVGKRISRIDRNPDGVTERVFTIIGVVKDFNFQTLHDPITPLAMLSTETFGGGGGYITTRVKAGELNNALKAIEQKWKSVVPDQPFKYLFLDEDLKMHYDAERRAGQVFAIFAGLAIVIACVGLFGLSAYTASLRTKEIGVRKVLGASVGSVVVLLSRDFSRLIVFAFIFAVPVSWIVMQRWLNGFAYHVDLGVGVFLIAGLVAILIASVTVSYQSIKAALVNPIKSLRSE